MPMSLSVVQTKTPLCRMILGGIQLLHVMAAACTNTNPSQLWWRSRI